MALLECYEQANCIWTSLHHLHFFFTLIKKYPLKNTPLNYLMAQKSGQLKNTHTEYPKGKVCCSVSKVWKICAEN